MIIGVILTIFAVLYSKRASEFSKESLNQQQKQELESKRRVVRDLQPKLKVWARTAGGGGRITIKAHVINYGKTPAHNAIFGFKGSNFVITVEKIGCSKTWEGKMQPRDVYIEIPHNDPLFNDKIENPEMTVNFHGKWHPEIEYPIIQVPFSRRVQPDAASCKYFPEFPAGIYQDPEWQYTCHEYSDE